MRRATCVWRLSIACLALCAGSISHAALVGHWVADDLSPGAAAPWPSRVGSWDAVQEGANSPVVVAGAIGTAGRNAVQFGDPPVGGLKVDNAVGPKNPLVGLSSWSATVVFETNHAAAGGGGNTAPGGWWMNAALLGNELGGGERGDWGIWLTDGNSTGGAKLGASRGDPDAGVFNSTVVNDGNLHIVTATYELTGGQHNVNLYLDGAAAGSSSTAAGGINNAVEDFALRFGSHNNFGFFKGLIGEIQLNDSALSASDALALHGSLTAAYNVPEPSGVLLTGFAALIVSSARRRASALCEQVA